MYKVFCIWMLLFTLSFSNEKEVAQTSQLELFLFKIGFQGLLNDVKNIKTQSNLNTKDLENITNKMEYMFNEISKNNTNLDKDFSSTTEQHNSDELKLMIASLEKRVKELENQLNEKETVPQKQIVSETKQTGLPTATVNIDHLDVYRTSSVSTKKIETLTKGTVLYLESCDKYGWCKLNNQNGYVKKHLIKIIR